MFHHKHMKTSDNIREICEKSYRKMHLFLGGSHSYLMSHITCGHCVKTGLPNVHTCMTAVIIYEGLGDDEARNVHRQGKQSMTE